MLPSNGERLIDYITFGLWLLIYLIANAIFYIIKLPWKVCQK